MLCMSHVGLSRPFNVNTIYSFIELVSCTLRVATRSPAGMLDYNDEGCFIELTHRLVHNFPKTVGGWDFYPMYTKSPDFYFKRPGGDPRNSCLSPHQ